MPTPRARILASKDPTVPTPLPCHPPPGLLGHWCGCMTPQRTHAGFLWEPHHTASVSYTQKMLDFPCTGWREGKEQRSWWLLPQCFIATSLISSPSLARGTLIIPSPQTVPAAFLIKTEVRRLGTPGSPPPFVMKQLCQSPKQGKTTPIRSVSPWFPQEAARLGQIPHPGALGATQGWE